MHLIGGWYRGAFARLESAISSAVDMLSFGINGLYRTAQPMLFVLIAAAVTLAWAMTWQG